MNRKERRATLKHGPPGAARAADAGSQINKLFLDALAFERAGKLDEAARAYKRVVTLNADHAEAHNNLARVLHAQGKAKDASASYARALALMPQLFQQYSGIRDTLTSLLPQLDEALRRQMAAWPKRSSVTGLFGESGFAAIADNPLLLIVLQSTPVRDVAFERLLTALRASLANDATAGNPVAESILGFACTLARQCFINEYVFATTPEEETKIDDAEACDRRQFSDRAADRGTRDVRAAAHGAVRAPRCLNENGIRTSRLCSPNSCASPRRRKRCAI